MRKLLRTALLSVISVLLFAAAIAAQAMFSVGPFADMIANIPAPEANTAERWFQSARANEIFEMFVLWPVALILVALLNRYDRGRELWFHSAIIALPGSLISGWGEPLKLVLSLVCYAVLVVAISFAVRSFRGRKAASEVAG